MKAEEVNKRTRNWMLEAYDGHLVIAFSPETGMPFIHGEARDPKTCIAINHILQNLAMQGGIKVIPQGPPPPPFGGEEMSNPG